MCATIRYKATISVNNEISKHHLSKTGSQKDIPFKLLGDNVNQKKGVSHIQADFQGEMTHMYSMIAVRGYVISNSSESVSHHNLESLSTCMVLPTANDVC